MPGRTPKTMVANRLFLFLSEGRGGVGIVMIEMYFDEVFPYRYLHGAYRPVVEVVLRYNNVSLPYFMLIDSGADISVLPKEVMSILSIAKE